MKSLNTIKKFGLAFLAFSIIGVSANAQALYKHRKRVRVEASTPDYTRNNDKSDSKVTPISTTTTTAGTINIENQIELNTVPVIETATASNSDEVVVVDTKKSSKTNTTEVTKKGGKHKVDLFGFTKKLKDNSKLFAIKDVKKSKLQKWLLWMIILLIMAVVFTILAIIFGLVLLGTASFALWTLFWILAALCYLGAVVFLILGLAGVM